MRSRSLLASSFLAVLLGCPLGQAPNASEASNPDGADDGRPDSGEGHDDPMDSPLDMSWVSSEPMLQGQSALRLLMTTQAASEADSVFVTICGISVESMPAGTTDPRSPDTAVPVPSGEGGRGGADDSGAGGSGGSGGAGGSDGMDGRAGYGGEAYGGQAGYTGDYREPCDGCDGTEPTPEPEPTEERDPDRYYETAPAPDAEVDGREPADAGGELDGRDPAPTPPADLEVRETRPIAEDCQTIDLLTLRNGVTEAIGVTVLPAGGYGNLRLVVTDASIVMRGFEYQLALPPGAESGVLINGGFSLNDGGAATVTLSFDAGRSITSASGGYMLAPVIHIMSVDHHDGSGPRPVDGYTRPAEPLPGDASDPSTAPSAPRPPEPPPPPSYEDDEAARREEEARRQEELARLEEEARLKEEERRQAEADGEEPPPPEEDPRAPSPA